MKLKYKWEGFTLTDCSTGRVIEEARSKPQALQRGRIQFNGTTEVVPFPGIARIKVSALPAAAEAALSFGEMRYA